MNSIPVTLGPDDVYAANDSEIYFTSGSELWHFDIISGETTSVADGLLGPVFLGSAGGNLFFADGDLSNDYDLWKTDGSSSGTMPLIEDFTSWVGINSITGIEFGNQIVLSTPSRELWVSDGTTEGSFQLARGYAPVEFGEKLIFVGSDNDHGDEPWISDGTLAGTNLLKDINQGTGSSGGYTGFVELNGELFFTAYTEELGVELWKTDGTQEGTVLAVDIAPGANEGVPLDLVRVGEYLYFSAYVESNYDNRELWKSNGTVEGTSVVMDINPDGSSDPTTFLKLNEKLVFSAFDGTNNELWITDSDSGNTFPITDISPVLRANGQIMVVGDQVVFENYAAGAGGLWTADTTSTDATQLTDSFPVGDFVALDNRILFPYRTPEFGIEPWISDLTADGTGLIVDLFPGREPGFSNQLPRFHVAGERVFFNATYSPTQSALFSTDGTENGTVIATQIIVSTADSGVEIKGTIGDKLLFSANQVPETGVPNDSLWVLENNVVTKLHGEDNQVYGPIVEWNGEWYFTAFRFDQGQGYRELYKTDGTAAGTTLLLDLKDVGIDRFFLQIYAIQSGVGIFARTPESGYELWTSDGSLEGTRLITEVAPGANGIFLHSVMPSTQEDEFLYFMADDSVNGTEVWRTDGSASGTSMLADIATGNVPIFPSSFRRIGSKVIFAANDDSADSPWGIYAWDEQDSSLSKVFGSIEGDFGDFFDVYGDRLRFRADGQLWETDGTVSGTQSLLSDAVLWNHFLWNSHGSLSGDDLFSLFVSTTQTRELWITDGTANGTVQLGQGFTSIRDGIEHDGRFFFSADDGIHGEELWSTDGTPEGTRLETDAYVGTNGSDPWNFTIAGGELYVTANSEKYGNELFQLDTSPLIVTNLDDYLSTDPAIDGSLRRMLEKAAAREGVDEITFEPALTGTLTLTEQLEVLEGNDVEITGTGNQAVSISGGGETRVLYVESASLGLSNLKIVDGFSTDFPETPTEINGFAVAPPAPGVFSAGGGIFNNAGTVNIDYVSFEGNQTGGILSAENPFGRSYIGLGGAIANFFGAELTVSNSRFASNFAIATGIAAAGAIDIDAFSRADIVGTSFTGNRAEALLGGIETIVDPNDPQTLQGGAVGGAIKASGGSELTLTRTIFLSNSAVAGDGIVGLGPRGGFAAGGGAVGSQALSLFVGVLPDFPTDTKIFNSRFIANQAVGGDGIAGSAGGPAVGGAIVNWGASELLLSRSYLAANTARGGRGGSGDSGISDGGQGGMAAGGAVDTGFSSFGTPITVIRSSIFLSNRALGGAGGTGFNSGLTGIGGNGQGGAMSNTADLLFERLGLGSLALGDLTMQFSIVRNNLASGGNGRIGGDGLGGGVFNQATTTIRYTPISGNVATGGSGSESDGEGLGGGIYNDAALEAMVDFDFISSRMLRRNRASTDGDDGYGLG